MERLWRPICETDDLKILPFKIFRCQNVKIIFYVASALFSNERHWYFSYKFLWICGKSHHYIEIQEKFKK